MRRSLNIMSGAEQEPFCFLIVRDFAVSCRHCKDKACAQRFMSKQVGEQRAPAARAHGSGHAQISVATIMTQGCARRQYLQASLCM